MHAREVYAHKVYAREVHARKVHAHEVHAHETHAYQMHAHEMHAYWVSIYEIYAHELGTWALLPPMCGDHSALKLEMMDSSALGCSCQLYPPIGSAKSAAWKLRSFRLRSDILPHMR
jgi:hypothetical protein